MNKIIMMDIETTGLVVDPGAILEVGMAIIEVPSLKPLEFVDYVVKDADLTHLSPWAKDTHEASGLLHALKHEAIWALPEIESIALAIIDKHFEVGSKPILSGNSIHFDRAWIEKYMPRLDKRLHYRMIDISGLWEWSKLFCGIDRPKFTGKVAHRTYKDIVGSIDLLRRFNNVHANQDETPSR